VKIEELMHELKRKTFSIRDSVSHNMAGRRVRCPVERLSSKCEAVRSGPAKVGYLVEF